MYIIETISSKEASKIVTKYHYSKKVVTNSTLHLGVFTGEGVLVGCLSYGYPINGNKTASKISPDSPMLELNRMVMDDDQPRNSESKAIGLCNRWLRRNTETKWLLSFSDGKQGNVGYIYQATNWLYLGYLLSDSFWDLDGDIVHNVTVWHRYKEKHVLRDTHTTPEIVSLSHRDVSVISSKQHIYVFPLDKRTTFLYPTQPYPKKNTEINIIKRRWIQRNKVPDTTVETYTSEAIKGIW